MAPLGRGVARVSMVTAMYSTCEVGALQIMTSISGFVALAASTGFTLQFYMPLD